MLNKFFFTLLLITVLTIGAYPALNAQSPYQFDGTTWTRNENYELLFIGDDWVVRSGSTVIVDSDYMGELSVNRNMLTLGNDSWSGDWGHAAGVWTLRSGTPGANSLDGTTWTKTEDFELSFTGNNWEVRNGSNVITSGDDMSAWRVSRNTLTFGNNRWWNTWAFAAASWTLKSGIPGTRTLDGTTWTRTAVLEISFRNGLIHLKDGSKTINFFDNRRNGTPYAVTSRDIFVYYSDGIANGAYAVNENTFTVTARGHFGVSWMGNTTWTRK
jgi:hypothetical protein